MIKNSYLPCLRVRKAFTMTGLSICLLLILLLAPACSGAAGEPVPVKGSLAADALDHLLKSKTYREFNAMYREMCRRDPAWARSELGLAAEAKLRMLRDDARAVKAIETVDGTTALQYSVGGELVKNDSVVTRDLGTNLPYRAAIIDAVVNNLYGYKVEEVRRQLVREYSRMTGEIPSPSHFAQEPFEKGIAAAKERDWQSAIASLQEARERDPSAPQIMLNLGIAESNLPGHELRSLAWFKAYLLVVPKAANAGAVRDQIARLESGFVARMRKILDGLQGVLDVRESEPIERELKQDVAESMRTYLRSAEWNLAAARYFLGDVDQATERVRRLFGEGWFDKAAHENVDPYLKADHYFLTSISSGRLSLEPFSPDPVDSLASLATKGPYSDDKLGVNFANNGTFTPEFTGLGVIGLHRSIMITDDLVREYARLHAIAQ